MLLRAVSSLLQILLVLSRLFFCREGGGGEMTGVLITRKAGVVACLSFPNDLLYLVF